MLYPPPRTDTYHVTYGVALIIVIIVLNLVALDVITGTSIFTNVFPVHNPSISTTQKMRLPQEQQRTATSSAMLATSTPKKP